MTSPLKPNPIFLKKLFVSQKKARKIKRFAKIRSIKYKALRVLRPLSSRGSLSLLALSCLFLALSFFGSNFIVELIYDPDISPIIPRWLLTIAIVSPVVLIYLNFLVLAQVVIDRLRKKSGTLLRFRIISFFLISLTVPSLFFILLFLNLYDYTLNIFNNDLLLNRLEQNLQSVQKEMSEEMQYMESSLAAFVGTAVASSVNNIHEMKNKILVRRNSKLIFYEVAPPLKKNTPPPNDENEKTTRATQIVLLPAAFSAFSPHSNTASVTESAAKNPAKSVKKAAIPYFRFSLLLSNTSSYCSYAEENGYLYCLQALPLPEENPSKANPSAQKIADKTPPRPPTYSALISPLNSNERQTIDELLLTVKELRQFELITGPLRIAFIFTIFYLYLQVFSISVLIFYQRSNKYLRPIQDLIAATKNIMATKSEKELLSPQKVGEALGKLNRHLKKMDDDEIRTLLLSFRQMIIELQQSRKRIQNISEIEGWKEIAKRLAHEIKNPLTPIQLAINAIESRLSSLSLTEYEALLPSFSLMHQEIKRIDNLAGEFSVFSKAQQLKKTKVSFAKMLKKLSNYFSYRKDVVFNLTQNQLPFLEIDEEKIYALLINLVENSLHAIDALASQDTHLKKQTNEPNHGAKTITIASRIVRQKKQRFAEISVTDNGGGIKRENYEEIFKPYFTLKSSGTGLGLAISKQIAYAHGGNLWVVQSSKKGTTIALSLPLINEKPLSPKAPAAPQLSYAKLKE